jgi:hypothetical protein
MVTHATLIERYGDSPAIKLARRTNTPIVALNHIDDEWVLTWTTGGKETITIHDAETLKLEPLYEETITYIEYGPRHRRTFKSEGATKLQPDKCPCCYDGLSFKDFSTIHVQLENNADIYLDWDIIITDQNEFTYQK